MASEPNISPVTGETYYSGPWENIQNVLRVLDIGEGKLANVNQQMVSGYQEGIDRSIDAILESVYLVPLRAMNQCQPSGDTVRVFPGDVRRLAIYWVSGLLLLTEFQQLSQNTTEQANKYIEESRRQMFAMTRFTNRLYGQIRKSNISRTLPPNMQPPDVVERDF